jgi:hypothetical protein
MKQRHFVIINIIFFGLVCFSASMVYQFMTGSQPWKFLLDFNQPVQQPAATNACSSKKPLENLARANNSSVRSLAVYQQACHSFVTDTVMLFLGMPDSKTDAVRYAAQDAKDLKAFKQAGIRPLVIAEPSTKEGKILDYALFANGSYDEITAAYFSELKKQGLHSEDLGIWNPFPEPNLPYWKNSHAKYFAPSVNHYFGIARQNFPTLTTSVMLNSATYETTDFNWENGDYNSLLPYVADITPGLIDYAGLQGFPWASRQGGDGVIFNAAEFLNPALLAEMADSLGTKKVWLNTGTFSAKYTLDAAQIRRISSGQRKEILMTIKEQAMILQKKGYQVAVNIFAEDKSEQTEETNWSYWPAGQPLSSVDAPVLTEFIRSLNEQKVAFWLFDR